MSVAVDDKIMRRIDKGYPQLNDNSGKSLKFIP